MAVRSRFFEEQGPIFQIAKSAMDASYMEDIEYHGEPVLVIIEGLTMYLSEADVKQIFDILDKRFSKAVVLVETDVAVCSKAYQGEIHREECGEVFMGRKKWCGVGTGNSSF